MQIHCFWMLFIETLLKKYKIRVETINLSFTELEYRNILPILIYIDVAGF